MATFYFPLLLLALTMFLLTTFGGLLAYVGIGSRNFVKLADNDFLIGIMLAATAFGILIPGYSEINKNGNIIQVFYFIFSLTFGFFSIYIFKKKLNFFKSGSFFNSIILLMSIHNFSEGLASGALIEKRIIANSFAIVFIIGIQNIPEGIIAFLANATLKNQNIKLAFFGVFITALFESLGNIFGGLLSSKLSFSVGYILAFSGGAMMQITLGEIIEKIKLQHTYNQFAVKILLGFFAMTIISI